MAHRRFKTGTDEKPLRDKKGNLVVKPLSEYSAKERQDHEDQLLLKNDRDKPIGRDKKLREFADTL